MAVLLSLGSDALPQYALQATIAAAVIRVGIATVREKSHAPWAERIPSVPAFGFALILPGVLNIPIAAGGIAGWVWTRLSRATYDRYAITVASGMIVVEALLGGLVLPVWAVLS